MLECRLVPTGGDEALDEQDVGAFVEHGAPHTELGQRQRPCRRAGRQAAKHLGAYEGVDEAGDALTGHQQPRVHLRAAPRVDALEQVTGPFEDEGARLDVGHVETRGGRETGHDRVTDEHVGRAERPAQPGETPAERAERVVCRREQLGAELASAQWALGQQNAGQQGP